MVYGRCLTLIVVVVGAALSAPTALAANGFWLGTDGTGPTVSGSAPYQEPYVNATYGSYVGEIGGWWDMPGLTGCGHAYFNSTDISAANVNLANYGSGVGAGAYWFMGGPGIDPSYGTYGGSAKEAWTWGVLQAKSAPSTYDSSRFSPGFNFPIVFMDIEGHQGSGGTTFGWNATATSGQCDAKAAVGIATTLDRCTFNGFWDWLEYGSGATPGTLCNSGGSQSATITGGFAAPQVVCCGSGLNPAPGAYANPGFWSFTFGSQGTITNTWEWTAQDAPGAYNNSNTNAPAPTAPSGWTYNYNSPPESGTSQLCESGDGPQCSCTAEGEFFGGQSPGGSHAVMWQWDAIASGDYDIVQKGILPSGW